MKHIPFALVFFCASTFAQDYYPLAIANKWSYVYSTHPVYPNPGTATYDSVDISVVADTLLFGGHHYYTLSTLDFVGGRYVRSDSVGIHYFDESQQRDVLVFPTSVAIGDTVQPAWQVVYSVKLTRRDTVEVLGESTTLLTYRIDGLIVQDVTFSDKFGPVHSDFYGDPAPLFPVAVHDIVGCTIDGLTYGTITKVTSSRQEPASFFLDQNFPNPFNPTTQIRFSSELPGDYRLSITNLLGQTVWEQTGFVERGTSETVLWNARDNSGAAVSSGAYLLRLDISGQTLTRRMVLLR